MRRYAVSFTTKYGFHDLELIECKSYDDAKRVVREFFPDCTFDAIWLISEDEK